MTMAAKKRDRSAEYARAKAKRELKSQRELQSKKPSDESLDDADKALAEHEERKKLIDAELVLLSQRTAENPTDTDRDIDYAYRNHGNPALMPLMAPSLGAWQWYEYARLNREKFLEVCAKREDAKAKQAGSITSQRMEDDKRKQFAILDRVERQLTVIVSEVIDDLMVKFPEDVLNSCRKHSAAWKAYFEKFPL